MLKKWLMALCALALLGAVPAWGASVSCFSPAELGDETITGVFLTQVPEDGALMLGERVLQAGDVLTAGQLEGVRFVGEDTGEDRVLRCRKVYADHVEPESEMVFSFRGKQDKPPVAEDSAEETYRNLALTGKLRATDPEGKAMTYQVLRQPRRGSVTLHPDGSFTYTPKKNKIGVDSFVYAATDEGGKTSREATVTITILKPTDATQYTDTVGADCRFAAEWMKNTGIFLAESVDGQSCFSPEKTVARGDFLAMLVKTLQIPVEPELTETGYETEIPKWLRPYLAAAVRAGLTAGTDDENFRPDEPITAREAAAMLPEEGLLEETDTPLTRGEAACLLYELHKSL